ncbi:hypothetical protein VTH82DRAFT_1510 [Thermothelomyces myriococcoides]
MRSTTPAPPPALPPSELPDPEAPTETRICNKKIEDYRPGYPRFTALLAAYEPYVICRRFTKLRARLLLLKQDQLSVLEARLEEVDQRERCPLFLGMSRCDTNSERAALLSEIESKLKEYDEFVERTRQMLTLSPARSRDVESLQNWLDSNGCIAEEECAYLTHRKDLISLAPCGDKASSKLETWVENMLVRHWRGFRKSRSHDLSDDPNVYIYSGPWIRRLARTLLLLLITFLLLVPVILCNLIDNFAIRIFVYVLCTVVYLLVVSLLTKSRTMELIFAGVTYATVLIVFVSGTDGGNT